MNETHRCWAEVDLNALRENLAWLKHRVGPAVKIMAVVKADAYGHGLKHIAALLMQSGTDIFGVANLAEARHIRSVGSGWPILMLGACLPEEVELAVRDDIMPTLSTAEEAQRFSAAAVHLGRTAKVQVKVDTGMGRIGVLPAEAPALVAAIQRLPNLKLQGLYTHFAAVEDDARYSQRQRQQFHKLVQRLQAGGVEIPWLHINNSGGLLHEPDALFNTVRPGLLVYGVVPLGKRRLTSILQRHLQPALTFKCRVTLVKDIPVGTTLSYGRTYTAKRRLRVATLTAGYGDGYLRAGSNRSQVLIGGQRCPILGRITMDQMLADVTRVKSVQAGDEVVLIGRQGAEMISASELAAWCGTIPWEVLTCITYRVPRLYKGGYAS